MSDRDPVDPRVEAIARRFHEAYERLAPAFGYETRRESAVAWEDVPEPNRSLMLAVAGEVLDALPSDRQGEDELREDEWQYTEEPADPDDPIIAGPRFKRERDELRKENERLREQVDDLMLVAGKVPLPQFQRILDAIREDAVSDAEELAVKLDRCRALLAASPERQEGER